MNRRQRKKKDAKGLILIFSCENEREIRKCSK